MKNYNEGAIRIKRKAHRYLTRQYMLARDFEIFQYCDTELERVSLHHHDYYECYFFLSGDVTYLVEGKAYNLRPGDIMLINSRELHQAVVNTKDIPYERIVLWIGKDYLSDLSTEETNLSACFENSKEGNVFRPELGMQQNIRALLDKLLDLEGYKGIGSKLLGKAYIIELLVNLNMMTLHSGIQLSKDVKNSSLIDSVIMYINDHLDERLAIEEISDKFYLSKYHLLREFTKHTGTTIHRYIVQKRLIRAKELLLQGLPAKNVYAQCGFGDYSIFFRAFKSEYGVTPKQFYQLAAKS